LFGADVSMPWGWKTDAADVRGRRAEDDCRAGSSWMQRPESQPKLRKPCMANSLQRQRGSSPPAAPRRASGVDFFKSVAQGC